MVVTQQGQCEIADVYKLVDGRTEHSKRISSTEGILGFSFRDNENPVIVWQEPTERIMVTFVEEADRVEEEIDTFCANSNEDFSFDFEFGFLGNYFDHHRERFEDLVSFTPIEYKRNALLRSFGVLGKHDCGEWSIVETEDKFYICSRF